MVLCMCSKIVCSCVLVFTLNFNVFLLFSFQNTNHKRVMSQIYVFLGACVYLLQAVACQIVFDDSVLYDISWAGPIRSTVQV